MQNLQVLDKIEADKKKLQNANTSYFGTVVEVVGKTAKVKIDNEETATDTFYQCLNQVNVGERVVLYYAGVQIIVLGGLS